MNRAILDQWSTHRRAGKLSLNTPPPPPGSAAAAALAAAAAESSQGGENRTSDADPSSSSLAPTSQPENLSSAEPDSSTRTPTADDGEDASRAKSPVKRKLRSTRDRGDDSRGDVKRSRAAGGGSEGKRGGAGGGGAIAKDYTPPSARLGDLGGLDGCIEKVLELIAMPLCHPEVYLHTGIHPPRGVLLHGPPGCGKTRLAQAIAGELGMPFISISAPSIVSGMSGESEKTVRETFEEAARIAPCILFLDEIDAITPKRETAQREMERRIVAQLLTCLDDLSWEKTDNKPVMIIGATNRPDSLDPALRRAGRFDHEISLGVPDEDAREQILQVLCSKLRLSGDFDFRTLAKATPGFVGADLNALTGAAGIVAVKRIFQQLGEGTLSLDPLVLEEAARSTAEQEGDVELTDGKEVNGVGSKADDMVVDGSTEEDVRPPPPSQAGPPGTRASRSPSIFDNLPPRLQMSSIANFLRTHVSPLTTAQLEPLNITNADFLQALPSVQPSSKREGFATVPDVTWSDIGALHDIREELHMAIVQPIKRPELFKAVGIEASSGVLLWGPPGCGKTLLAKAVANESRANFISVKGPELLNKYVGESERAVRQVFMRARASSPCVIFFDELDALVPRRDDSQSEASSRVVNTLLTELDGLESRRQTYVIAATNRPDMIDPAMVRPGRLDKLLYVDLPSAEERSDILWTMTRKTPLDGSVSLPTVGMDPRCDGFSGADLAALVREAAVAALRGAIQLSIAADVGADANGRVPTVLVTSAHFDAALDKVQPSVSAAQRRKYALLRSRLAGAPVGREAERGAEKKAEAREGGRAGQGEDPAAGGVGSEGA